MPHHELGNRLVTQEVNLFPYSFWLKCMRLEFCLSVLDLALCLELLSMVVADVRSLHALAQALLHGVILLASSSTTQSSQFPPSRSVGRRRRKQATLRKLYSASVDSSSQAHEDSPI